MVDVALLGLLCGKLLLAFKGQRILQEAVGGWEAPVTVLVSDNEDQEDCSGEGDEERTWAVLLSHVDGDQV